ncbi:putative glutathione-specific gamma-glutamylcyclotransferase 2, partial [Pseudolycoriella hygida]
KNCGVEYAGSETKIVYDSKDLTTEKANHASDQTLENEFWVFGYGSLVWKVDFPIECSRTGYIKGYLRRFYQNSIDHRGTKERPGRVVTLVPSDDMESKVFGMAYKIPGDKTKQVLKHLDFREKNGYERHYVQFFPLDSNEMGDLPANEIVIYVATNENESFAGSTGDLTCIVDQIFSAVGPSGSNREYVYQLAEAMRHHFPDQNDEHLFEIESLLRERERR